MLQNIINLILFIIYKYYKIQKERNNRLAYENLILEKTMSPFNVYSSTLGHFKINTFSFFNPYYEEENITHHYCWRCRHCTWRLAFYLSPPATENMDCHWRCRCWHCHDVCEPIAIGRPQFSAGRRYCTVCSLGRCDAMEFDSPESKIGRFN